LKKEQTGTVKLAESRLGRSRVGRVNGRDDATHWLSRAVDQVGFVLDETDLLTVGWTPVLIGYARVSIEDQHRLNRAGIFTVAQLWKATPFQLRRIWGGINGVLFHQMLRGVDIQPPPPASPKGSGTNTF
jgi:hypothetical protein